MKEFIVAENEDLQSVSQQILEAKKHTLFLLRGDLGAGKTTLSKSLIACLGSTDNVTSPTFSIINEYTGSEHKMYHIDLYRLNTIEEALDIGIEDYLHSGNNCFIEWPDLIKPILPNEHHNLEIHILDDNKRKIIFE